MTLKELRMRANLRQVDVGKRLDIDQAAVSRWESGDTRPSRKYHKKLMRLYGCTVNELLEAVGKPRPALKEEERDERNR